MINIVVAADINGIIGNKGKVPWDIPEDRKFFKKLTTGHYVIMGRKTWDSLPEQYRPLPNRENLIITHLGPQWGGTEGNMIGEWDQTYCGSLERALDLTTDKPEKEIFIIGGGQIYKEALEKDLVDRIYLTYILRGCDGGDTFFPKIQWEDWEYSKKIGPIILNDFCKVYVNDRKRRTKQS